MGEQSMGEHWMGEHWTGGHYTGRRLTKQIQTDQTKRQPLRARVFLRQSCSFGFKARSEFEGKIKGKRRPLLRHRASDLRKHSVGITADQTHRANDDH